MKQATENILIKMIRIQNARGCCVYCFVLQRHFVYLNF
jgi:hypothetical protein